MDSGCSVSASDTCLTLLGLRPGARGVVLGVVPDVGGRTERLAAVGVTAGAVVTVLQVRPGVIFRCDETELAVEPIVAAAILIELLP